MIWFLLLIGAALIAYFLVAPRRLQTLENIPQEVDDNFRAHGTVETTEDPREVRPRAAKLAKEAGDRPAPGHGDSLTRDWPSDQREPHADGHQSEQGPLNPQ